MILLQKIFYLPVKIKKKVIHIRNLSEKESGCAEVLQKRERGVYCTFIASAKIGIITLTSTGLSCLLRCIWHLLIPALQGR